MVDRIKAAKDPITKDDFMLMARTDALKEGINSVIDRSNAFVEGSRFNLPRSYYKIRRLP